MLTSLIDMVYPLVVVVLWGIMAWKTLWLIRAIGSAIRYVRTRQPSDYTRKVLAYLGFIEEDEDDKYY